MSLQTIERSTIRLSLVIPLYNEAMNVDRVIAPLMRVLESSAISYELLLVNNGSSDGTGLLLKRWAKKTPAIRVVSVAVNEGYGWGIIQGLRQARGEYISFMSGDGQIQPEDPVRVYQALVNGGGEVAKITRATRCDGWLRLVNSFFYNRLCWILFQTNSRDFNGTPKIMTRKALEAFDLGSKDWFIDAEWMLKARWLGYSVLEIPTVYLARPGGRSKVRLSALFEFMRNIIATKWGGCFDSWKRQQKRSVLSEVARESESLVG